MSDTVTIRTTLTCKLVGTPKTAFPDRDPDVVLDAFAAAVGTQNGAKNPLRFTVSYDDAGEPDVVYEVWLVD